MVLKCTMIFDMHVPMYLSRREHLGGEWDENSTARAHSADDTPPRGFESYLLELADACHAFRVLVVGPRAVKLLEKYAKFYTTVRPIDIFKDGIDVPRVFVGFWRGYQTYAKPELDEPEGSDVPFNGTRGYLSATADAEPIGAFQVTNWTAEP